MNKKLLIAVAIVGGFTGCNVVSSKSVSDNLNDKYQNMRAFISVWQADKNNNDTITIPINNNYHNYDYIVDWGDGKVSKNIHNSITHTYKKDGNYTVKIKGIFPAIKFGITEDWNSPNQKNANSIIKITQWGDISWRTFEEAFSFCNNLNIEAKDNPKLENVKSFAKAFFKASNFNSDISGWNTSHITDMSRMFEGTKFNKDISNWDTSNVKDMHYMFKDTNFNQPIGSWNVSNVENMSGMFENDEAFNQNLNGWTTSKVVFMNYMFAGAKNFNKPIGNWNTSNVKYMDFMFAGASNFNQPIGNWDTSKVVNMAGMFKGASSFNQDINGWDTSNVKYMDKVFEGASSFNKPLGDWNISNVKRFFAMFKNASSFNLSNLNGWQRSDVNTSEVNMTIFCGGFADGAVGDTSVLPYPFNQCPSLSN